MRNVFVIIGVFFFLSVSAQENPILGHWSLSYDESDVVLDWTIISGNTCQGIYIWRSIDGVNFEEIGHIPGLCGSVSEPIDYIWQDPEPVELSTNYYRIELGGQGLSTVKSVYVDKLVQTGSLVYPNPASEDATLIFQINSGNAVDVNVFNGLGSLVLSRSVSGSDRISIPAGSLGPGTYVYRVTSQIGSSSGRFIIL